MILFPADSNQAWEAELFKHNKGCLFVQSVGLFANFILSSTEFKADKGYLHPEHCPSTALLASIDPCQNEGSALRISNNEALPCYRITPSLLLGQLHCLVGHLEVQVGKQTKTFGITRAHLEEDAGTLLYESICSWLGHVCEAFLSCAQ